MKIVRSAPMDDLTSSVETSDLELMSCNKTWPSTSEIGALTVMLQPNQHKAFKVLRTSHTYKNRTAGIVMEMMRVMMKTKTGARGQ